MLRSFRSVRAVALVAVAAATFTTAPAYAGTAAMSGTVTDSATGDPVANVCVLLWREEGDTAWEQYPDSCTDETGTWSYSDLDPGVYYVEARGGGYVTQYAYGQDYSFDATRWTLGDGDSVTVDLAMQRGGTISGTVTDATTGEPVQGACATTQGEGTFGHSCTDESGWYELSGLRPGADYRIWFTDYTYGRYTPEYAHDAKDYEAATTFTVTADETTVVDESLQPAAGVTGTITDATTGDPLIDVCVSLAAEPESFDVAGNACSDEGGIYRISGVEPGTYHVVVDDYTGAHPRTWYPGTHVPSESTTVTVESGQVQEGMDFALQPAGYVSGTVTKASTGEPLAGVCVGAYRASDGGPVRNNGDLQCSDDSGHYTIGGIPTSTVNLLFNPTDGIHLESRVNGVAVTAGETTTGIDAAIVEGGRITGRITDAKTKKAVAGACVTVGVFSHRSGENGTQWPGVCTEADGRYELRGLPTGTYDVEFYDPDGVWAWQYFPGKADRLQAAKLSVTAGQTLSGINAKLSPGGTIEGVVIDAATGQPADGVCMDPYSAREPKPFGTGWCTGPDGRYVLRGFPTTKVKVQYWGDGYVPEWAFDKQTFETATPISTVGGGTVRVPNVVLARYPS
ncbi:MAG TPA: carboxypeptidase regulatory-like domain-containing protein [Mycobacteriales bacterium]|jgi:5-hydroxyisourate hydrolase-like protein (transthyretin family)